jgi:cytochrome c oxidase subunit I+III
MPEDTLVPLALALSMTVVTTGLAMINWAVIGVGATSVLTSILLWLWPRRSLGETAQSTESTAPVPIPGRVWLNGVLPIGALDRRASGWWAMIFTVFTEAALFGYLLFSYYYMAVQPHGVGAFPEGGSPKILMAAINTAILLTSSLAVGWAQFGIERGGKVRLVVGLGIGTVLGLIFLAIQWQEWSEKPFGLSSTPYSSLYYVITGFHMAHVVAGVIGLGALTLWSALGFFNSRRFAPIHIGALYWHFVDAVWIAVFFTFYITPLLGLKT